MHRVSIGAFEAGSTGANISSVKGTASTRIDMVLEARRAGGEGDAVRYEDSRNDTDGEKLSVLYVSDTVQVPGWY